MADPRPFLPDAQKLLARLEKDLRLRCDERPDIVAPLSDMYEEARLKGRTAFTFEEWRSGMITQHAVAWLLQCVFVRYLEDNDHIFPPKLSGINGRLNHARDQHEMYFLKHPKNSDRDYLQSIFTDLAKMSATRELFDKYNLLHFLPDWLSPDAAKDEVLPFFQRIDPENGALLHRFKNPPRDTRFLGDLYQDLSEQARKAFALLQTPTFVEEFILERTLRPAIATFGLEKVRMIDPACGSGHFLLGAFRMLLNEWQRLQPAMPVREQVNRVLSAIHGVDLNPYAVAIARFRLLIEAWKAIGGQGHIQNIPAFETNLACGDSLLHGDWLEQAEFAFDNDDEYYYPHEDREAARRLLRSKSYHAVVANPPYITPKDRGLNEKYRKRYSACHMKYSLAVPFMQRIFDLACEGGYTGQITANSFMKREFGKKLIQEFFPTIDLTHVLDTSGAYIPGHGTPTVILFGRQRKPVGGTIRTVLGIRGEPTTPDDPARGQVWSAIVQQIDQPGSQSAFVSVADSLRQNFHRHPWSIGGGGASELKELLEDAASIKLDNLAESIGFASFTGTDDVFLLEPAISARLRLPCALMRPSVQGDNVRDWQIDEELLGLVPYDRALEPIPFAPGEPWGRYLWCFRTALESVVSFGGKTRKESGDKWWTWYRWVPEKFRTSLSLVFGEIASHNHFVLDRGNKVFKQTAPVVKLPNTTTEHDYLALLGLLNSSTACFYLKQICHQKQLTGGDGVRVESRAKVPYAFAGTSVGRLPVPESWKQGVLRERLIGVTQEIDTNSQSLARLTPSRAIEDALAEKTDIDKVWSRFQTERQRLRSRMIVLQEELDFTVYAMFGLTDQGTLCDPAQLPAVSIDAGDRPFDIVRGKNEDGFPVPSSIPPHWPENFRAVWQKRIEGIESSAELRLIEDPHYKRRWIGRQGLFNQSKKDHELPSACETWLLDRLESYFDFDGRMNDAGKPTTQVEVALISTAKLADIASRDSAFQTVAELYRGRPDFDVTKLVAELVEAESVPLLPVLRYKPTGLDKRRAWERTWELQRKEDAIDARATLEGIGVNDGGWSAATDDGKAPLNKAQAEVLKKEKIGPIPPPPKYKSADFQKGDFWRLRGGLDVPKERWVIFPHCEGADGLPLIAWAGYDHLQMTKAIANHYVRVQEQEGGRDDPRLVPLLACLIELLPWLKQWHNEYDADYGVAMGDYYEGFVQDEARLMGRTIEEVRAWQPPAKKTSRKATKPQSKKEA